MTTGRINQVAHEKTRTHAPKRPANALADKPRDTEQPTPRKCTHAGAGAHSRVGRHASQRTHRQCSHEDRTSRPRMLPRTQENAMARRSQRTLCQEAMDARKPLSEPHEPSPGAGLHSETSQCSVNNRASHRHTRLLPGRRAPSGGRLDAGMDRVRGDAPPTPKVQPPEPTHLTHEEEALRARRAASVLTRRCPLGNHPILSLGRCPSNRLLGR